MAPQTPPHHRAAIAVMVGGLVAVGLGLARGAPGSLLLAHPLGEAGGHLWLQWLLERSLAGGGGFVGAEGVVMGERLWVLPTDGLSRLLGLPLGLLFGRVVAFDLTVLGLLALGTGAVARLAGALGARPLPAALASLLFLWSPALLGFAADGRVDSLGIVWLPVLALAWLRATRAPSWRSGALLALAAVAVALAGINHAVVTALVMAPPTLVALLRDRRRALPYGMGALAGGVAIGVLVSTLLEVEGHDPGRLTQLSNPEGRQLITTVTTAMIHEGRMADFWWGAQRLHRAAGPFDWWRLPETVLRIAHTHHAADTLTVQSFAPGGFWWTPAVPWALAAIGLWRDPRGLGPLVALAAAAQVLGMGYGFPHMLPLKLGSHTLYVAPAVLLEGIPGLDRFNNYGLFSVVAAMAHAVVAARVFSGLAWGRVAGLAAVGLWTVEVMRGPVPLPLDTTRVDLDPALVAPLAGLPADEGVLTLPLSRDLAFLLQSHHGHPTPHRFRAGPAKAQRDPMLADPTDAIHQLITVARGERRPQGHERHALRAAGLGAVVVVPQLLPPKQARQLETPLHAALGTPDWAGPAGAVWRLAPPP